MSELGKLVPPYPVAECANIDCPDSSLDGGAYLYRDMETEKVVVFCDRCRITVDLNAPLRFRLVAL